MPPKRYLTLLIFIIFATFFKISISYPHLSIPQFFYTSPPKVLRENNNDFVAITKGVRGFTVEVYIPPKNNKFQFSKNTDPKSEFVKSMMIFLYTSKTILPRSCESFLTYDCNQFDCEEFLDSDMKIYFPYFLANGYKIKANIHLGTFWQFNDKGIRSTSCSEGLLYSYGAGTYGGIGLGMTGGGKRNFRDMYPIFSVYINEKGTEGELWPSKNLSKSQSSTPIAVVNSTESWHIFGIDDIQVGDISLNYNQTETKIIFDINQDTLGFPSYIFVRILKALQRTDVPIKCPQVPYTNLYRPKCAYNGDLKYLPNITFTIQGQRIDIPLLDYVENPGNYSPAEGFIVLNFNAHNNTAKIPETYVTKNYENSIILDRHFMMRYYTVFNSSGPHIEFYLAKHGQFKENTISITLILIIAGSIISLFAVAILVMCCQKVRVEKIEKKNDDQQVGILAQDSQRQGSQDQHEGPSSVSKMNDPRVTRLDFNQQSQVHLMKESADRTPKVEADESIDDMIN